MKRSWTAEGLIEHWTLARVELKLLANKRGATRLGFAILLKAFQFEGRFPKDKSEISPIVLEYVAKQVNIPVEIFSAYDWTGRASKYHRVQIREFLGFRAATVQDAEALVEWLCGQEAVPGSSFDDLLAVAYAHCREQCLEPPTPERMNRLVRSAVRRVEKDFTEAVLRCLPQAVQERLEALLEPEAREENQDEEETEDSKMTWYELKADPGRVGLQSMLREIAKLQYIRQIDLPDDLFAHTPSKILTHYRRRAAAETVTELRRHPRALRLTLVGVCQRYAKK